MSPPAVHAPPRRSRSSPRRRDFVVSGAQITADLVGQLPDADRLLQVAVEALGQKPLLVVAGNIPNPRTEADPRGRQYLQEVEPYLDRRPLKVGWPKHPFDHYQPDGGLPGRAWPGSPEHARKVKAEAAEIVARIHRRPPKPQQFPQKRRPLFEHLLAYLNSRGERPVIVFNPLYPTVYAALAHYGRPVTSGSLDYLRSLRSRYRFVVVDCESIHTWGGTVSDWSNATHVNRLNMRRMLRYVVQHSDGALG